VAFAIVTAMLKHTTSVLVVGVLLCLVPDLQKTFNQELNVGQYAGVMTFVSVISCLKQATFLLESSLLLCLVCELQQPSSLALELRKTFSEFLPILNF
jgi:hypothetical protein